MAQGGRRDEYRIDNSNARLKRHERIAEEKTDTGQFERYNRRSYVLPSCDLKNMVHTVVLVPRNIGNEQALPQQSQCVVGLGHEAERFGNIPRER